MEKIGLLFPHQLFDQHIILEECDRIYLVEEYLFFKQYPFHKQKLAFHRASMKAFEAHLQARSIQVIYIESHEERSDIRLLIPAIAQEQTVESLYYIDPTDEWLTLRIKSASEQKGIPITSYENPLFLNSRKDLTSYFTKDRKSFFQTTFYKQQRKKFDILMQPDGSPEGGKWTYDTENRKKYPKGKTPPTVHFPESNDYWDEAVNYVNHHFGDNYGEIGSPIFYPLTHQEAQQWFQQFLEVRFHEFGAYEDAIVRNESILNHSVLSPLINIGLLPIKEVVEKSLLFAKTENVPLNSKEGFIRQLIGWREFIRGMYEYKGNVSRTRNFWGFTRKIPSSFYDGTTGIDPIDETIKKVLKTGYCHHIERLMVLGNFMLLCEFDPDDVYQWFMELFIDAYDWVMVPNVYGMSQFADGGFFATKPYISSSNYIKKMSDYGNGEWQQIWNGLFWRFMHLHQGLFRKNPRTSMLLSTYNRMSEEKRKEHLRHAEKFLQDLGE